MMMMMTTAAVRSMATGAVSTCRVRLLCAVSSSDHIGEQSGASSDVPPPRYDDICSADRTGGGGGGGGGGSTGGADPALPTYGDYIRSLHVVVAIDLNTHRRLNIVSPVASAQPPSPPPSAVA